MDCKEIQKWYIPFIDDELSPKELAAFLEHLDTCQDCREEYDIYYMMFTGIRHLEQDPVKGSVWIDSGQKLGYAAEYLKRCRRRHWIKLMALGALCVTGDD